MEISLGKRALISVWDKTGLDSLAQFFNKNEIEIISTGGTKKYIENLGINVTPISDITGMDAIMDGRVKTLHPKIFGGILADRKNKNHMLALELIGANQIDIVVVNFYPFADEAIEKKMELKDAIEFIDIGGPSMIRAAAKNYHSVIPLCDQTFYEPFMEIYESNGSEIPLDLRLKWASEVFKLTSEYEKEHGFKYDCVMLARFDLAWQTDLIFEQILTLPTCSRLWLEAEHLLSAPVLPSKSPVCP